MAPTSSSHYPDPEFIRTHFEELRQYLETQHITDVDGELKRMKNAFGSSSAQYARNCLDQVRQTDSCILIEPDGLNSSGGTHLYWPGLPSKAFYDENDLPWISSLPENLIQDVREEVLSAAHDSKQFQEYDEWYTYGGSDQQQEGLSSGAGHWKTVFLYEHFQRNNQLCDRVFPSTDQLIQHVPHRMGDCFLACLVPGGEVRSHHGPSNIKVTCHLGLQVPSDGVCELRVGTQSRAWQVGRWFGFNDGFVHSAINESATTERYVLILDVWNPALTPTEILALRFLLELQTSRGGCVSDLACCGCYDCHCVRQPGCCTAGPISCTCDCCTGCSCSCCGTSCSCSML